MIFIGDIKKKIEYFNNKGKKLCRLSFHICVGKSPAMFSGNFFMNLYSADSNKAMKR